MIELEYWDELANQDEPILLTVTPKQREGNAGGGGDELDLVPPITKVIRTRWPGAEVEWSGGGS